MDGLLVINKEAGWTSHDVVAKLRKILGEKKVGHTGTLDPDATGVLPVCLGKATKLAQYTMESEKEYWVVMKLGVVTDTLDASGKEKGISPVFNKTGLIPFSAIKEAFDKYTGKISQLPPMYSAKKVAGVPLYRYARKGQTVSREPRQVIIKKITLLDYSGVYVTFLVRCSKGTYVRTLCADIGDYLGVGAHMYSLERIESGPFSINDALTISQVEHLKSSDMLSSRILRMEIITEWMPTVTIKESWYNLVKCGRPVTKDGFIKVEGNVSEGTRVRIVGVKGRLHAIGISLVNYNEACNRTNQVVFKLDRVLI